MAEDGHFDIFAVILDAHTITINTDVNKKTSLIISDFLAML